jgi:hypothetical protein
VRALLQGLKPVSVGFYVAVETATHKAKTKSEEKCGGERTHRGEVPRLREPTRSLRSEREEKASARFGRNDRRFAAAQKTMTA